jgi:predicted RND superfamily exporter protein
MIKRGVGGMLGGMVLILSMFLDPFKALLVLLMVAGVVVEVLGVVACTGAPLDAVSYSFMVLCIGICVDFSVHMAHSINNIKGTSMDEIVLTAMKHTYRVFRF